MTIPATNPISLSTIKKEFGGGYRLSDYYAGQDYVPPISYNSAYGISPSSGAISLNSLRDTTKKSWFAAASGDAGSLSGIYYSLSSDIVFTTKPIIDSSGNIYVAGYSVTTGVMYSPKCCALYKFDDSGNILWTRRLTSLPTYANDAVLTSLAFGESDGAGGYYIYAAGYGISPNTTTTYGVNTSGLLVKYNSSGTLQYQRGSEYSVTGGEVWFNSMAVSSTGQVYLLGATGTSGNYITSLWYIYGPTGTPNWQRRMGSTVTLSATQTGTAIVLDEANSFLYFTSMISASDISLFKYDTTGTIQWQKTYTTVVNQDYSWSLAKDSSGNIYMAGQSGYTAFLGDTIIDAYISKIDSSGNIVWQRFFGDSGTYNVQKAFSITVDAYDNIYIVGEDSGFLFSQGFILKYNTSGTIQWQRSTYYNVYLSSTYPYVKLNGVVAAPAGSLPQLYVCGQLTTKGSYNGFLAKLPTSDVATYSAAGLSYGNIIYYPLTKTEAAANLTTSTATFPESTLVNIVHRVVNFVEKDFIANTFVYIAPITVPKLQIMRGGMGSYEHADIALTPTNNHVMLAGSMQDYTYPMGTGQVRHTIKKIDSAGIHVQTNLYGNTSGGRLYGTGIDVGASYDTYTSGYGYSNPSYYSTGQLVKTDSTGTVQWNKQVFPLSGFVNLQGVKVESYAGSYTNFPITVGSTGSTNGPNRGLILQTNVSGVMQWARLVGDGSGTLQSQFNSVALSKDANQNSYSAGYTNLSYPGYSGIKGVLAKYSATGVVQWTSTLADPSGSIVWYDVAYCNFNNVVYVVGRQSQYPSTNNLVLAKYDTSGALLWQRTISKPSVYTYGYGICTDIYNGNIWICGTIQAGTYGFMAKYNPAGVIQWQKVLVSPGSNTMVLKRIKNSYIAWGGKASGLINTITVVGSSYEFNPDLSPYQENFSLIAKFWDGVATGYGDTVAGRFKWNSAPYYGGYSLFSYDAADAASTFTASTTALSEAQASVTLATYTTAFGATYDRLDCAIGY